NYRQPSRPKTFVRRSVRSAFFLLSLATGGGLAFVELLIQLHKDEGDVVLVRPALIRVSGSNRAGCQFAFLSGDADLGPTAFVAKSVGRVTLINGEPTGFDDYELVTIDTSPFLLTSRMNRFVSLGFHLRTGVQWPVTAEVGGDSTRADTLVECHLEPQGQRLTIVSEKPMLVWF